MTVKAIETRYKGYRFRSRLEARWAVFFDALGIKWEYEKEGYDLGDCVRYLPDFFLYLSTGPYKGVGGYWVEIKGLEPTQEEFDRCQRLASQTRHCTFLAVGMPCPDGPSETRKWGWDGRFVPYLIDQEDRATRYLWHPFETHMAFVCGSDTAYERLGFAADAARSARFEHGESGA